jgi:hypothetical protein
MDNSRENGIGKQEWTILEQRKRQTRMDNSRENGRDKQEWTILEKTEEASKNGKSRDLGTRHRTKINKTKTTTQNIRLRRTPL